MYVESIDLINYATLSTYTKLKRGVLMIICVESLECHWVSSNYTHQKIHTFEKERMGLVRIWTVVHIIHCEKSELFHNYFEQILNRICEFHLRAWGKYGQRSTFNKAHRKNEIFQNDTMTICSIAATRNGSCSFFRVVNEQKNSRVYLFIGKNEYARKFYSSSLSQNAFILLKNIQMT